MRYLVLNFILLCCCAGCINEYERKNYYGTTEICNKFYIESFVVFGKGAFGGDIHSKYLTDSIHFRMYIDTIDTYSEFITVKCQGDLVLIEKYKTNEDDSAKLLYRKRYSRNELMSKENLKEP